VKRCPKVLPAMSEKGANGQNTYCPPSALRVSKNTKPGAGPGSEAKSQ